jgi:hypothetical protein
MTAVTKRRRKAAIGAALLAPLVLLGARRAVRATALRRNELRRELSARTRAAIVQPTATGATSERVREATESVEPASVAPAVEGAQATVAERKRRKGKTLRFALAASSVALIAVFIQHAQSRVPRPTLAVEGPTNSFPAVARLSSGERLKTRAALRSRTSDRVPASTTPARRRSVPRASRQTLREHRPTHPSHASLPSGRRTTKPLLPAKHAGARPASGAHVVGGPAFHGLRWNPVAGATYYNLVLWRDGKRILDLWPSTPRVVVPSTSVDYAPQRRLSPGRYVWFVYPGFGAKRARQYGALAGTGVLVVPTQGGK